MTTEDVAHACCQISTKMDGDHSSVRTIQRSRFLLPKTHPSLSSALRSTLVGSLIRDTTDITPFSLSTSQQ